MSWLLAVPTGLDVEPDGVELRRLKQRVDLSALIARGWDSESRVFAPVADDPLFGYHRCERVRCPRAGESRRARELGLCDACAKNFFRRAEQATGTREPETLEAFKRRPLRRHAQAETEALCLVCRTPGHERGARTLGLCLDCDRHRRARRQTVEAFVAGHPRLGIPKPRPSFGRCRVDDCRRWAISELSFCRVCHRRWLNIPTANRLLERERFSRPVRGSRCLTAGGPRCPRSRSWSSGSCSPGFSC